jgi:hypothetical protein
MPSQTYLLFRAAILGRKQVTCLYRGKYRELCPHVLGTKSGQERALVTSSPERATPACRRQVSGAAGGSTRSATPAPGTEIGIPVGATPRRKLALTSSMSTPIADLPPVGFPRCARLCNTTVSASWGLSWPVCVWAAIGR